MVCQAFHFLRDGHRIDARRPSESTSGGGRAPPEEGEHLRSRESTSGGGRAPQEQGEHLRRRASTSGGGRAPQEKGEHLRSRESTSGAGRAPQEEGEHGLSLLLCSVTSLGLTLCDPVDCGPPGSSVHGILQAKILACVAVSFCRGLHNQRTLT